MFGYDGVAFVQGIKIQVSRWWRTSGALPGKRIPNRFVNASFTADDLD
jgi:hypothetical protein